MSELNQLKLFISYSHEDESHVDDFRKYLAPLKTKEMVSDWYDRKIIGGQEFQSEIDSNLEDADIICLFISPNFLSSRACIKEKTDAIGLKQKKGLSVVSIILCDCGWLDDEDIARFLVMPTDGKPIAGWKDSNSAWMDVYNQLKLVIEKEHRIRQLKISDRFSSFLQSTEILTKTHSRREDVFLDDIFVYPELTKYSDDLEESEERISARKVIENFSDYSKMLIAGENQSGKTTLCKRFFIELRKKNFVLIYVSGGEDGYSGKIENRLSKAFNDQYGSDVSFEEIEESRIVPLLDNFHFANRRERLLQSLTTYHHQIIIVDDIFRLNFRDKNLIKSFVHFNIEEFIPSLRNQLIMNWLQLRDEDSSDKHNENATYQHIDHATELVDSALGKALGRGIMPAYPFFILTVTVINAVEADPKPFDQEITSQGYCYQALVYMSLRKLGVRSDDIDTYMNFLTELAYFFYQSRKHELSEDEFDKFKRAYGEKYNLPIKENMLLSNLQRTRILAWDGFGNLSFCYLYLYFFFVAKYFAEHLDENRETIRDIVRNLHEDDNAYIAAFLSHHSKNVYILDEILSIASDLFKEYKPSTLNYEELEFFDEQIDIIVEAALAEAENKPEQEREKDLKTKDELEQLDRNGDAYGQREEEASSKREREARELRRSIKTVEVMGTIIKNRAGSLEKYKLESVFEGGMKVYLRLLRLFVDSIKKEEVQQRLIDIIATRLDSIIKDKKGRPNSDELEKISRIIFWNLSFFSLYGLIDKIVHSLGSAKLTETIDNVCTRESTPAAFLVKHGSLMWYNKNLRVNDIKNADKSGDFSEIAKTIMKHMIVDHCRIHPIDFKDRQKVEQQLDIPRKKLLLSRLKGTL